MSKFYEYELNGFLFLICWNFQKIIFKFTLLISSYGYSLTFSILPFKSYII